MTPDSTNMENQLEHEQETLWVFGYGSLVWKTSFKYEDAQIGYISGYKRRFWQGSTTHRGHPKAPGRVATLIEDNLSDVWGMAFQLVGSTQIQNAMDHLGVRECTLGGYKCLKVPFICRSEDVGNIKALVFMASTDNQWYLGECPLETMVHEILATRGDAGHNVEYVTKLADFTRQNIPEDTDPHLFELDSLIRNNLFQQRICLNCLIVDENMQKHKRTNNARITDETSSCHKVDSMFICTFCDYECMVLKTDHKTSSNSSVSA